jgi:hypothetical protein
LLNLKEQASRVKALKEAQSPSPLDKIQPILQKSKAKIKELLP